MAEKRNQKKVFNFDDSPLVKTTEQTVVEGYQRLENEARPDTGQGGGEPSPTTAPQQAETAPLKPAQEITAPRQQPAAQQPVSLTIPATAQVAQGEPTQNINVPIPISLHSRLAIIKAKTRQNMKDLVVLAIRDYVERQEGSAAVR